MIRTVFRQTVNKLQSVSVRYGFHMLSQLTMLAEHFKMYFCFAISHNTFSWNMCMFLLNIMYMSVHVESTDVDRFPWPRGCYDGPAPPGNTVPWMPHEFMYSYECVTCFWKQDFNPWYRIRRQLNVLAAQIEIGILCNSCPMYTPVQTNHGAICNKSCAHSSAEQRCLTNWTN